MPRGDPISGRCSAYRRVCGIALAQAPKIARKTKPGSGWCTDSEKGARSRASNRDLQEVEGILWCRSEGGAGEFKIIFMNTEEQGATGSFTCRPNRRSRARRNQGLSSPWVFRAPDRLTACPTPRTRASRTRNRLTKPPAGSFNTIGADIQVATAPGTSSLNHSESVSQFCGTLHSDSRQGST